MKIKTNRSIKGRRYIAPIILAIVLLFGCVAVASYYFKWWPFNSTKQTTQEQKAGTSIKRQSQDNQKRLVPGSTSTENGGAVGSTPTPTPTPGSSGEKSTIPVTITTASQSGSSLQIRVLIGAITTGTCTLTLTGPGATYTATASVQSLPSSSTCKGFTVPTSQLSSGTWNVVVNFENDSLQGSASQKVTMQ